MENRSPAPEARPESHRLGADLRRGRPTARPCRRCGAARRSPVDRRVGASTRCVGCDQGPASTKSPVSPTAGPLRSPARTSNLGVAHHHALQNDGPAVAMRVSLAADVLVHNHPELGDAREVARSSQMAYSPSRATPSAQIASTRPVSAYCYRVATILVPEPRFELGCPFGRPILSRLRLPVPPLRPAEAYPRRGYPRRARNARKSGISASALPRAGRLPGRSPSGRSPGSRRASTAKPYAASPLT